MGRSGIGVQIERADSGVSTTEAQLRQAALAFLDESWQRMLDPETYSEARLWFCLGEDSLLTVEVCDDTLRFWFYVSGDWPQGRAEHWLEMALATRRCWLDDHLRPLGYRLDLSSVPRVTTFYEPRKAGWCDCPACRWFDRTQLPRGTRAAEGWSLEVVDGHSLGDEAYIELAHDRGEIVMGLSWDRPELFAWLRGTQRLDPEGGPWIFLALDRSDRVWVARATSGQTLCSQDGTRWIPTLPSGPAAVELVCVRGAVVWLEGDGALWRSTDAGRTFTRWPAPPTSAPCMSVEGAGELVVAACGDELWRYDGASWQRIEDLPPLDFPEVTIDEDRRHIAVLAENAAYFSRDGGASWSEWAGGTALLGVVSRSGRWWAIGHPPGLLTSPELGAPWEACADADCYRLFADPDEADTVWAQARGSVLRVRRQV